jgi:hypothetical protein
MNSTEDRPTRANSAAWLLLSLFATTITLCYFFTILQPWEHYLDVERGRLKAEMGDLYPRWVGTRAVLLHGENPYGPEVSHEIQYAFYGHAIEQNYEHPNGALVDEQRFAYPVYVIFLLAPTVHLNFSQLQTWAPPLFAILTGVSLLLWLDVLRWRPSKLLTTAIVLFVLSSPQVVQGLRLRQLGMLVAFFIAMAAWCVSRSHFAIGGVFMALATIKPQMALFPVAWFLIWSLGSWPKRSVLLASFGVAFSVLIGLGEWVVPGWPLYFFKAMIAYRHYASTTSLFSLLAGTWVSIPVSLVVVAVLLALAWQNRQADADSRQFVYVLLLFCISALFVLPLFTPFNQVLVLLPVLLIVRNWSVLPRAGRGAFAFIVSWPWISSLFLLTIHRPNLSSPHQTPLLPSVMSLAFPTIVLLLIVTRSIRIDFHAFPNTDHRCTGPLGAS